MNEQVPSKDQLPIRACRPWQEPSAPTQADRANAEPPQQPSKEQNIQPATEFLTGLRHCTATAERVILERADFFRLLSLADRGAAPEPPAAPLQWYTVHGSLCPISENGCAMEPLHVRPAKTHEVYLKADVDARATQPPATALQTQQVRDWFADHCGELPNDAYHALANIIGDPDVKRAWSARRSTSTKEVKPACVECHGAGQICTGNSGREDDGYAPILERCEACDGSGLGEEG